MRASTQAIAVSPPLPSERRSWDQIRQRFPDQQVYVIEPEHSHPDHPDFLSAVVVGASPVEEEAFAQAEPHWHDGHLIERRFTGKSKEPVRFQE